MVCMAHRKFHLSEEAAREMQAAYLATDDGPYRTRLQAVRLYGLGYSPAQIAEIAGCPRSTLMDWTSTYRTGGIAALNDHRVGGNSRKLSVEQVKNLTSKLGLYPPRSLFGPEAATADGQAWTVDDLRRAVQEWYGVLYQSVTSYYSLFDRCGYSYHRPTKVFKSRSERAVMEWESEIEKN